MMAKVQTRSASFGRSMRRFIYDAVSAGKSCTICSFLCLDEIVTRWLLLPVECGKWDRMNKREGD